MVFEIADAMLTTMSELVTGLTEIVQVFDVVVHVLTACWPSVKLAHERADKSAMINSRRFIPLAPSTIWGKS